MLLLVPPTFSLLVPASMSVNIVLRGHARDAVWVQGAKYSGRRNITSERHNSRQGMLVAEEMGSGVPFPGQGSSRDSHTAISIWNRKRP